MKDVQACAHESVRAEFDRIQKRPGLHLVACAVRPDSQRTPPANYCSEELKKILDNEEFRAADFWEGYKLYCFAHYSQCDSSKGHFQVSKMGRVMCALQSTGVVAWGVQFDESIRQAWTMMEEYVLLRHGTDCTNLGTLVEKFDNEENLSMSNNGRLLLQLIEDNAHGIERQYRQSLTVQFDFTVFDKVRNRLKQAQVNLANLTPKTKIAQRQKD